MRKLTSTLLASTLAALVPFHAHAVVGVGNPGDLRVSMAGATDATAIVTVVESCPGGDTILEDQISVDLLAGLGLDAPPAGCTHDISIETDLTIEGSNSSGVFEIVVDASEFEANERDLPLTLAYTVVSGTVTSAPVLLLD